MSNPKHKPSQIVRSLMVVTGKGTFMFNDGIGHGATRGRSIKVWGWDDLCYDTAVMALEKQGYTVKKVVTRPSNSKWIDGGNIRLHVTGGSR